MSVSGNATSEEAALTSRASLRRPHEQPAISRLQGSASRHAQRHEPPARTQARSAATWVRGARPSNPLALEGALALGPAVPRPLPPVLRDRVPVQAVAPRYVAEVRLGPGGPVHVQLAHHVPLHPRSSRWLRVRGWSICPFARLVKARLRGWRVSVSAGGAMRLREWLVLH